jgi:hypothetical protein
MESVVIARTGVEETWKDTDSSRKENSRKSKTQKGIRRRFEGTTPSFLYLFLSLFSSIFCFPDSLILFLSFVHFSATFTTLLVAERVKSLKWHSQKIL